jgi:hypothetical protein
VKVEKGKVISKVETLKGWNVESEWTAPAKPVAKKTPAKK